MAYQYTQQGLFDFLDAGASPFHAVAAAEHLLQAAGATYLPEMGEWSLQAGGVYYTKRNGSSIAAFRIPAGGMARYCVAASHSDAPTWRVKTLKGGDKQYAKAEVEGYGGMIMASWMDRPLSLAGRVIVKTTEDGKTKLESVLVYPQHALLCIPSVAIHFNRTVNTGYAYNPQVDLQPIFGAAGDSLEDVLKAELSLPESAQLVGHDLVLCPVQQAVALGAKGEQFMSPRIDDLECAYTTLAAFLQVCAEVVQGADDTCKVWVMFDNEEVGSSSRQGANGSFLTDIFARVEECSQLSANASVRLRAGGFLLSADNGHALHPNHPEKSDPEHPITLGGGVVLKYNASQKYTTNGFTASLFAEICKGAGVPVQTFYNRADIVGGGTLGNLLSHQIAIPMVDIGLAQLAMHASVETANLADAAQMAKAVAAVYRAVFTQLDDGVWCVAE